MKKESLLYKYIALSPPVIILFYLYTKNGAYINYWHTVAAALVFALLSLAFYAVAARIGKPSGGRAALLVAAFWALSVMGRIVYRNIRRIMPFSETLIVRFALGIVVLLIVLAVFIMIFIYGKRVQRKETFLLIAVFETVLLTLNIVPATASFIARENANRLSVSAVVPDEDFAVNPDAPSPNIYWLFMDGMLGFKGMETLFDDSQDEFTAQLKERDFLINRDAEFEVFNATIRGIPALFCPTWYDKSFLPLLKTIDLDNYKEKEKRLGMIIPAVRWKNEFIRAFNAKGYVTYAISCKGCYNHNSFSTTVKKYFVGSSKQKAISDLEEKALSHQYTQLSNLHNLLCNTFAPYRFIERVLSKAPNKAINNANNYLSETGKTILGEKYSERTPEIDWWDSWYPSALEHIFHENMQPRLVIIHELRAHLPYIINEDGEIWLPTDGKGDWQSSEKYYDPYNYPPQHRYAARVVTGYIDFILKYDPDAIIVVQADHGLHTEKPRKVLLAAGRTEEDVRVMQNSVISAVRIPKRWGGLDQPLDPLDISRVLVNRYVGENYKLVEEHP